MNCREREIATLSFSNTGLDYGVVEESMEPWDLTVKNWAEQGYDSGMLDILHGAELPTENVYALNEPFDNWNYYYNTMQTETVMQFETGLGLDPVARITFRVPYICFEEEILEETDEAVVKRDRDGWIRKYPKNPEELVRIIRPVVTDRDDWEALKERVRKTIREQLSPERMEQAYGKLRKGAEAGDYAVRLRISGFFWTPRFLLDNEEHLIAYFDDPDMLKDMARFTVDTYKEHLDGILKIAKPSLVFFEEDLSGRNGPLISPDQFDEFLAPYYREMIPFLKERGVANVFMDTDGDFTLLIPNILECGIDGVLPVDVNAGVDIVEVRKLFPTLKFFGGFNKLCIADGKEAIEKELKRLRPVIAQGGCIICTDHQAAPHTKLDDYRYYVQRLKETVAELRNESVVI